MLAAQSCPTLCEPMDCSPQVPLCMWILLARILEWVAISFSRGSSQPNDQTGVSCIARLFSTWKSLEKSLGLLNSRLTYIREKFCYRKRWLVIPSSPLLGCPQNGHCHTSLPLTVMGSQCKPGAYCIT